MSFEEEDASSSSYWRQKLAQDASEDGIDWKQRFEALVDKIEDVEERMTKVVYKLKSESLENKQNAENWKNKFIALQEAVTRDEQERGSKFIVHGGDGEEERRQLEAAFQATIEAHERAVGDYNDAPNLPSAEVAVAKRLLVSPNVNGRSHSEVVQAMVIGRIFNLYTEGGNALMLVQYRPGTKKKERGSITWRPPTANPNHVSGSLPLKSITGVQIGKESDVFKSNIGKFAERTRVLTIEGRDGEINLEAKTESQLTAWLFLFTVLLNFKGRQKVGLDAQSDRKMSVTVRDDEAQEGGQPEELNDPVASFDLPTTVKMMTAGSLFTRFMADGRKHKIKLFYRADEGRYGTLYFCAANLREKNPSRAIDLEDLEEFFFPEEKENSETRRFQINSKQHHLDLEGVHSESVEWVYGINRILTMDGTKQFKYKEEAGNGPSGTRRFSVIDLTASSQPDRLHDQQYDQKASNALKAMSKGAVFLLFKEHRGDAYVENVVVQFKAGEGGLGTIYWRKLGSKGVQNAFKLSSLREIALGNESKVFQLPSAEGVDERLRFSMIGASSQLHLQASDPVLANTWISGIYHSVRHNDDGNQVVIDYHFSEQRSKPPPNGRRISFVVPKEAEGEYHSGAEAVRDMEKGCQWSRWSTDGRRTEVFLFFSADDGTPSGSLYWCDPGRRDRHPDCQIPVDKITDFYASNLHPFWKSFRSPRASRCMSIVSESAVLHVSNGTSSAIQRRWTQGLSHLLKKNQEEGVNYIVQEQPAGRDDNDKKFTARRFSVIKREDEGEEKVDPSLYEQKAQAAMYEMQNGTVFNVFVRDNGRITKRKIKLFLDKSSGRYGALFACSPDKRHKKGLRIPCHQISHLLMHSHSDIFQDPNCPAHSESCFSILALDNKELHLEAESLEQVNTWFSGIMHLCQEGGQLVKSDSSQQNVPVATAAAASSPASPPNSSAGADGAADVQVPMEVIVAQMCEGAVFTAYGSMENPLCQDIFLFFDNDDDTPFGSFYWCKPGTKQKKKINRLPLNTLTDIFVGKRRKVFKHPKAAGAIDSRVLSLKSATKELNIQAQDDKTAKHWWWALGYLTHTTGNQLQLMETETVKTGRTGNTFERRRFSVIQKDGAYDKSEGTYEEKATDALENMKTGHSFTAFFNSVHGPTKEAIFIWYEEDETPFGTIYWSEPNQPFASRVKEARYRLPLHSMTDLFSGPQNEIFKSPVAAGSAPECSFSLVGMRASLHLVADSLFLANLWLSGIKHILFKKGQKVSNANAGSSGGDQPQRRFSVVIGRDAQRSDEQIMQDMADGVFVTSFGTDTRPKREEIFLWYVKEDGTKMGSIYWCRPGQQQQRALKRDKRLPMHLLRDIHLGKQAPIFSHPVAADCVEERCMSLRSTKAQLNVELRSEAQIRDWLTGIKSILTSRSGRNFNLREEDPAAAKHVASSSGGRFARRSFSVIQAENPGNSREQTGAGSYGQKGERARNMMQDGAIFNYFSLDRNRRTTCKQIFVFLEPGKGKFGTLYWCPVGQRVASEHAKLPLDAIVDLFVGKQSKVLSQGIAQKALQDCCFTLDSKKAVLDLEAETVEQANTWLSGIKYILDNKGQPAEMDKSEALELGSRRISVAIGRDMSKSKTQILAEMQRGCPVTVFGTEHQPRREEVLLFYSPTEGKYGTLFWCPMGPGGQKIKSGNAALALHTVSDMFTGKAANPVFGTTIAAGVQENRCLSVVGTAELHCEMPSEDTVKDWISGITHIFNNTSNAMVENNPPLPRAEGEPEPGRFQARSFSVVNNPGKQVHELTQDYATKARAAVDAMVQGHEATQYGNPNKPNNRRRVYVFFDPREGALGTLFWSVSGQKLKTARHSLALDLLEEMCVGTEQNVFRGTQARSDCCFSLLGAGHKLHLEMASPSQVNTWISGIKHVLEECGQEVEEDAQQVTSAVDGAIITQRRFSLVIGKESESKDSKVDFMRALQQRGIEFMMIPAFGGPMTPALVKLDVRSGKSGALHWGPAPAQRLDLASLTDIFTGKQHQAFRAAAAAAAQPLNEECCLSLTSTQQRRELHLVARSEEDAKELLSVLHMILSSTGQREVRLLEVTEEAAQQPQAHIDNSRFARRQYSITRAPTENSSHSASAPLPSRNAWGSPIHASAPTPASASIAEPTDATSGSAPAAASGAARSLMARGGVVRRFGDGHGQQCALWYEPQKHRFGTLYWAAPHGPRTASEAQALPLHTLTNVYVGTAHASQRQVFERYRQGGPPRPECCMSLQGQFATLHIEAASPAELESWQAGIQQALQAAGQRVTLDEAQPGRDSAGGSFQQRRFSVTGATQPTQPTQPIQPIQATQPHGGGFESQQFGGQTLGLRASPPRKQVGTIASALNPNNYAAGSARGSPDRSAERAFSVIAELGAREGMSYEQKAADATREMGRGSSFVVHFGREEPMHRVAVFFEPHEGRFGTFYWCAEGKRVKSRANSLELETCTDIYVGQQLKVFNDKAREECCFSIIGKRSLHLEANSIHQVNTWVSGIRHVLLAARQHVILSELQELVAASGKSYSERRLSISIAHNESSQLSAAQCVALLESGMRMKSFGTTANPSESEVTFFYDPSDGGHLGTFFWCSSSEKTKLSHQSLKLHSITDIYQGTDLPIFRSRACKTADPERCVSLESTVGAGSEFHGQAFSTDDLQTFMEALKTILTADGQRTMVE